MFIPGGWHLNPDELARKQILKAIVFLLNNICTFGFELANGLCVTLKITAVTVNDEDTSRSPIKCTCGTQGS